MATTHKVEIAFATQPYDPSPTWTDVTAYFSAAGGDAAQITRGRPDQVSSIGPAQLSLTLDNHDGRFTAGYTSGAYYPNVVLGKRIRISTSTGAGFTERFDGYVDTWPVQWAPTGRYAEAQITASDRLKKLQRQLSADNLISTYYLANSPSDYWMFADAVDTEIPANRTGSTVLRARDFGVGGGITFGDSTGPQYDGLTAVAIKGEAFDALTSPTYTFSETQSLSLCGFVRCAGGTILGSAFSLFDMWDGLTHPEISIVIGNGGNTVEPFIINSAGTLVGPTGSANVLDGTTHFICMVLQGLGVGNGGTMSCYVDGVLDSSSAITSAYLTGGISAPLRITTEDFGSAGTYTCAHFAIFQSALTAQNAADFANAGLTAFSGETSLARTTRIAGLAGVTPVVTGTAGTVSMSPLIDVNGADYLTMLQTVADTEGGMLFTQCDGQVRLRPRRDMQNQSTKWTLTNGQYGTDLTFLLDDFGVINDAIATRPGGNQQEIQNATSIAANGTYSVSTTLQTTDDNEVLSYAQWQVNTSTPAPRCSQVSVDLLAQPSLVATYLTLELGDRITLSGLPTTAPASSVNLIVQGWTETIALDSYSVTMNTSPLPPNVWKLGDATLGVLGSTTVLAY